MTVMTVMTVTVMTVGLAGSRLRWAHLWCEGQFPCWTNWQSAYAEKIRENREVRSQPLRRINNTIHKCSECDVANSKFIGQRKGRSLSKAFLKVKDSKFSGSRGLSLTLKICINFDLVTSVLFHLFKSDVCVFGELVRLCDIFTWPPFTTRLPSSGLRFFSAPWKDTDNFANPTSASRASRKSHSNVSECVLCPVRLYTCKCHKKNINLNFCISMYIQNYSDMFIESL